MGYSALARQYIQSPNYSARTATVEAVILHYMAGELSAVGCAQMFANPARQASSHYCVGSDGYIVCSCDEAYRAWTSGSDWADSRAITIEVASLADGSITDAAMNAVVELIADIAKRYSLYIPFRYTGDTRGELWAHRWFQATSCPGDWLLSRFGQIADKVAAKVGGQSTPQKETASDNLYRVRKAWNQPSTQLGAYKSLDSAKAICQKYAGYSVFDQSGKAVYTTPTASGKTVTTVDWNAVLKVGDKVVSKSTHITGFNGNAVSVPELGGWIDAADLDEATDTKDGKQDQVLSNLSARVSLKKAQILAVDVNADRVQVKGNGTGKAFWIPAAPLGRVDVKTV